MAREKSSRTEKMIEQYACYLDGKIHLAPVSVHRLEEKLKESSFRGIGAGKLLEIFTRCAEYPSPFSRDWAEPQGSVAVY
jgi:hypothetical protein